MATILENGGNTIFNTKLWLKALRFLVELEHFGTAAKRRQYTEKWQKVNFDSKLLSNRHRDMPIFSWITTNFV